MRDLTAMRPGRRTLQPRHHAEAAARLLDGQVRRYTAAAPAVNIFFDVDHTIVDGDNRLRSGVRELFGRLRAGGHVIYLWSGIGPRWEIVRAHGLEPLVTGCFDKPLYHYEAMLVPLGIPVRPDFVVDDHPHLVHAFGGCVVAPCRSAEAADDEMERVLAEVERALARRRQAGR